MNLLNFRYFIITVFALGSVPFVGGCSDDGKLTKKDDAELRNNFTRALTPEEIARMNGAKPAGDKKK